MARIVSETVNIVFSAIAPNDGDDPLIISTDDLEKIQALVDSLGETGRVVEVELAGSE